VTPAPDIWYAGVSIQLDALMNLPSTDNAARSTRRFRRPFRTSAPGVTFSGLGLYCFMEVPCPCRDALVERHICIRRRYSSWTCRGVNGGRHQRYRFYLLHELPSRL
jgi:hypothetical protein